MYKTTKKDFEEFKKECKYWIDYFGLKEWDCYYAHERPHDKRNRAEIKYNTYAKNVTFYLNPEISSETGDKLIPFGGRDWAAKSAFHEVCELLLAPLYHFAAYTFNEEEVQKESHNIIQRLTNTIYEEHKK